MKDFIAEIELSCGTYNNSDYPLKKEIYRVKIKEWYRRTKSCKEIYSETYGLLRNIKTNRNLFLGFITLANQHTCINIIAKKMFLTIDATVDLNKYLLLPGFSVSSEKLRISVMEDAKKLSSNM